MDAEIRTEERKAGGSVRLPLPPSTYAGSARCADDRIQFAPKRFLLQQEWRERLSFDRPRLT
jgi:hypothetical protein